MSILSISNPLLPVSGSSTILSDRKTGPSQSSTASSASAQLAADTYTPSQTVANNSSVAAAADSTAPTVRSRPGPNYLNGQELAQNQVISTDPDVVGALLFAGGFHNSSTDQAWSGITQSLASGDIATAQTALATYAQILPTAPEALSPLTEPSTQFLDDLTTLGSSLQSGDLAAARSDFQTALYDKPTSMGAAYALAYDTGNSGALPTLLLESVENTTAELTALGYTPANAKLEANLIEIGGATGVTDVESQSPSAQTNQWVIDLAKDVASGPQLTASQSNDISGNPFYAIMKSLLTLTSSSDLNKTLELLVSTYASGGASNSGGSGSSESSGQPAGSASVNVYA